MNQRIKKLWIGALRSGKYKQGTGALRISDRDGVLLFCCLGVLCDLHAKATGGHWDGQSYLSVMSVLPSPVVRWAGISDGSPNPRLGPRRRAADMNDSGKSFNYIADRIEKYL